MAQHTLSNYKFRSSLSIQPLNSSTINKDYGFKPWFNWRRLCKGIINTLCSHASLRAIVCAYRNEAKASLFFLNNLILTTSIIWCNEMPNFTRTVSLFFNTGWSSGSYLVNKNVNSLFSSSSVTSFNSSSWKKKIKQDYNFIPYTYLETFHSSITKDFIQCLIDLSICLLFYCKDYLCDVNKTWIDRSLSLIRFKTEKLFVVE